jgi:signal transduction histidine kinase
MTAYRALRTDDAAGRFVVRDGGFVYVSPQFATLAGVEPEVLRRRDPVDVFALDTEDGDDGDGAETDVGALLQGRHDAPTEGFSRQLRLRRANHCPLPVTVTFSRLGSDDTATLGVVVPPVSPRTHTISALEQATTDLVRATSRRAVCTVAVETLTEAFGFEAASVHSVEDGERLVASASTAADTTIPAVVPTDGDGPLWDAVVTGETRAVSGDVIGLDPVADVFVVPLNDTELLLAVPADDAGVDDRAELLSLLASNVAASLDRVRREERLERLHDATRDLMAAETEAEVADIAVSTAHDVLRHDLCGVHLYDAEREALVPVAASVRTRELLGDDGDLPTFEPGNSLTFAAFEAGETRVYDDLWDEPDVMDPDTSLRSELIVPLGERGVFLAASVLPDRFDEADVSLANVLGANVEAALERAEREAAFREQQAELRAQNGRLDEFASVVSHDLRNPLNVAEGHLELAREACSCDGTAAHFETVAESHARMGELIEDLLTLARQGRGVGDTEAVDVGALARTCWEGLGEGTLDVVDTVTVDADRSRLRALVENLVRNSVEHAGPEPTVRLGALEDEGATVGFYVEDDGPGIPADERDRVFEHGYSTETDGTGFGLSIVRAVADAHGWDVRVTDGSDGGARFEFLL